MIICISNVLSSEDAQDILVTLKEAVFVDGKLTAGQHAKDVKQNMQLSSQWDGAKSVKAAIAQALQTHPVLQLAARPKLIRPVMISRYETDMHYGTHVDNALMQNGSAPMRSDLSLTLFLSDPSTYEGGELTIETHQGEQSFKLEAGSAILYPSSTLHRVEPVTAGVRVAAVTWIQSFIRDPQQREVLFDLDTVRHSLDSSSHQPAFDLLSKSVSNLLRLWADV